MSRDFKKAKDILKYLKRRYGKMKKNNIEDDLKYGRAIAGDHSLEELMMMEKDLIH